MLKDVLLLRILCVIHITYYDSVDAPRVTLHFRFNIHGTKSTNLHKLRAPDMPLQSEEPRHVKPIFVENKFATENGRRSG